MLRQVRLVSSGCQNWNKAVISQGGDHFAYCSTLATYFIDLRTFSITKIIAAHENNISCIAWNTQRPSQIASISVENLLYVWDIDSDLPLLSMQITNPVIMMEFNPFNSDLLIFLHDNGDIRVLSLSTRVFTRKANYLSLHPQIIRFHPTVQGRFALGCLDGVALFCEMSHDHVKRLEKPKHKHAVEDLQWDPLSDKYLLVAYKDGSMCMFDVEAQMIMQSFDRQEKGIKSIAWNKAAPGEFFTASAALKVWSVSKKSPTETLKVGNSGLKSAIYLHEQRSLLCSFENGSVGIYNLVKRKLDFCTEPGHAETVFDISISPYDKNVLATASYDGTVKIWNVKTMKNVETLSSDDLEMGVYKKIMPSKSVLYSLTWGPNNLIAASSAKGDILLFDYSKPMLLHRFKPTIDAPIFRIDWCPTKSEFLALGTSDNLLVVLKLENKKLKEFTRIKHPNTVYGVNWHPKEPNLVASGCQDWKVRVFDLAVPDKTIELAGHEGKVFNVVWNPCFNNILASSSDDQTVMVWNTETRTRIALLQGHTQKTRAILWNSEFPWMLVSGSWDASIRVWDIRTAQCLHVSNDHHADVYGLTSHKNRPFMMVSCSRDTSLRFWSFEDYVASLELKALVENWEDLRGEASMSVSDQMKLCGVGSQNISLNLPSLPLEDKYRMILNFFRFRVGEDDFFDLVSHKKSGREPNASNSILPLEELCASKRSRASELETASGMAFLGTPLAKKQDRLQAAADIHLKLGNIKQYCELMIKLGKWERAMAFAPGYCMDYWQKVCERYAQHMAQLEREDASNIYLAASKVEKAVNYYMKRHEYQDAFIVAASKNAGMFSPVPPEGPRPSLESQENKANLQTISKSIANNYFESSEAVLAAACHLAMDDIPAALVKLERSNELTYAYVLMKLFGVKNKGILRLIGKRAERLGLWQVGFSLLEDDLELKELLGSKLPSPGSYELCGLLNIGEYKRRAEEEIANGNLKEGIRLLAVARDTPRACEVFVKEFKAAISEERPFDHLLEAITYMGYLDLEEMTIKEKAEVISIGALLGAMQSLWKGYPIVQCLLGTFSNLCKHQNLEFPVTPAFIEILQSLLDFNNENAKEQLRKLQSNVGEDCKKSLETLTDQLNKSRPPVTKNHMKVVGSQLPSSNSLSNAPTSIFTKKVISGPSFVLQPNFAISLEEALMWAKVNPFSPMNDGRTINPF